MLVPERVLENFGLSARQARKQTWSTRALRGIGALTYRHAKLILALLVVVVAVAIWGITRIQINDNYARRFVKGHPIRDADIALNKHFSGTYTAYLILEGRKSARPTTEDIAKIKHDLVQYAQQVANEYTEAPRLAQQICHTFPRLAEQSDTFEGFLGAAIQSMEAHSADASDDEFYAWQELQSFFGLEVEKLKTFKRPEVLEYLAGLQAHMEQTGLIGRSQSAADVVRKVNQELIDGQPRNFRIPATVQGVAECYMQFQQSHRPHELWHLVTPDYQRANVWIQFANGDSRSTEAAVRALDAYLSTHAPPVPLDHRWAGLHYINLVLEGRLVWGFLRSLVGSFLIVFVMMTVLFRSPLWGLLCMAPLTITLVAIYGTTGLIGKDYDLPIAVLSALSIGMAVDFAIHFLQRGRMTYRKTGSWQATIPKMFGEPARAISRNVLVIAIGFLPLLTAPLVPYKTTGLMLFAILTSSGIVTLLALPAVLTVAEKTFFGKITKRDSQSAETVEAVA
jgi:predicted RND superfamily exporter protein